MHLREEFFFCLCFLHFNQRATEVFEQRTYINVALGNVFLLCGRFHLLNTFRQNCFFLIVMDDRCKRHKLCFLLRYSVQFKVEYSCNGEPNQNDKVGNYGTILCFLLYSNLNILNDLLNLCGSTKILHRMMNVSQNHASTSDSHESSCTETLSSFKFKFIYLNSAPLSDLQVLFLFQNWKNWITLYVTQNL